MPTFKLLPKHLLNRSYHQGVHITRSLFALNSSCPCVSAFMCPNASRHQCKGECKGNDSTHMYILGQTVSDLKMDEETSVAMVAQEQTS